jgi:hypothetical protein
MTVALLTSFESSAIQNTADLLVLTGTEARGNLQNLVPPNIGAIISWGTVGALSPRALVGQAVVAPRVMLDNGSVLSDPGWISWATRIRNAVWSTHSWQGADLIFSDAREMAATPAQRAALYKRSGASVVDQGAFAAAQWARRNGKLFVAVGAVSDAWDQTVVVPAGSLRGDGSLDTGAALEALLADPEELPDVVEEAWTAQAALHSLSVIAAILAAGRWGLE